MGTICIGFKLFNFGQALGGNLLLLHNSIFGHAYAANYGSTRGLKSPHKPEVLHIAYSKV